MNSEAQHALPDDGKRVKQNQWRFNDNGNQQGDG
jgi:hypothetical protein